MKFKTNLLSGKKLYIFGYTVMRNNKIFKAFIIDL